MNCIIFDRCCSKKRSDTKVPNNQNILYDILQSIYLCRKYKEEKFVQFLIPRTAMESESSS